MRPRSASGSAFSGPKADQQDIVVEGQELAVTARIALPAATADQLAIDARRIVHFGQNHMQAAEFGDAFSEADVGSAAGHVRGHGHAILFTRGGDDLGFAGDLPGVEHLMLDCRPR